MRAIAQKIRDFLRDEEGLTMVEYAVAGGMIAAAGVVTFGLLGKNVDRVMVLLNDQLSGVGVATP